MHSGGGACVTCMAGVCVAAGQVWRGEHVWHGGGKHGWGEVWEGACVADTTRYGQ